VERAVGEMGRLREEVREMEEELRELENKDSNSNSNVKENEE
jgi:hemerythrin-like domain-containing protein